MPTIQELLDRRASVWEEAKKLNDDVESRDGKYTAEEQTTWDRLNADIDGIDERIKRAEDLEQREASIREKTGGRNFGADDPYVLDKAIRSVADGSRKGFDISLPESSKIPVFQSRAQVQEWVEKRADMAKGSSATGGAIVAEPVFVRLIEFLVEGSGLLPNCTIVTTSKGEQMTWPKLSSYGVANSEVAEAGSGDATEPTFTTAMTLDAYKYMQTVLISRELFDDAMIDVGEFVLRAIAQNLIIGSAAFGQRIVVGSGSSQPNGIVTATTTGVTGATSVSGVPDMDDLIDLQHSVTSPYAVNASWLMRRATAGVIRKFREGSGTGAYLWQPSHQKGQPDLLLGDPVVQDPYVAATATSAKSVLYGDLSKYIVRLVGNIRLERDDSVKFLEDQIAFKAVLRGDGDLSDTNATRNFVGGAS